MLLLQNYKDLRLFCKFVQNSKFRLFKEYNNKLQILQDNIRLRNLYNQHIAFNEKEEILKIEEKIKKNISDLPEQLDLLVYNQKDDCLMKIEYKDYELNYSVI